MPGSSKVPAGQVVVKSTVVSTLPLAGTVLRSSRMAEEDLGVPQETVPPGPLTVNDKRSARNSTVMGRSLPFVNVTVVPSSAPRAASIVSGTESETVLAEVSSLAEACLAVSTDSLSTKGSAAIAFSGETFPTEAPTGATAKGAV